MSFSNVAFDDTTACGNKNVEFVIEPTFTENPAFLQPQTLQEVNILDFSPRSKGQSGGELGGPDKGENLKGLTASMNNSLYNAGPCTYTKSIGDCAI